MFDVFIDIANFFNWNSAILNIYLYKSWVELVIEASQGTGA